MDTA
jgi:hypothetical protein